MFTTTQIPKQRSDRRKIIVLHEHSLNRSTISVPYLVTHRQCVGTLRKARGLSSAPPWKEEIRKLGILMRIHSSWMQLATWRVKKSTKYQWLCQNSDDQSPCWVDDATVSYCICICICMRSTLQRTRSTSGALPQRAIWIKIQQDMCHHDLERGGRIKSTGTRFTFR